MNDQNRSVYDPNRGMKRVVYVFGGLTGAMVLLAAAATAKSYSVYSDFMTRLKDQERAVSLYKEATLLADLNKNSVTTKDEWKELFKKNGLHFDEQNPDFSLGNLEKITGKEDK